MKNALYHINADLILPMKLSFNKLETNQKKNADAAGPLGDLGHTAPVLIPQYLRNHISF